jgi:hypothetical protein
MTKYNYNCINCNCGLKGEQRDFVVNGSDSFTEQQQVVILCDNSFEDLPMKLMGTKISGCYTKFNGLSKQEKRGLLKKRATNHFNKEIKEQKHEKWKQLAREVKGK